MKVIRNILLCYLAWGFLIAVICMASGLFSTLLNLGNGTAVLTGSFLYIIVLWLPMLIWMFTSSGYQAWICVVIVLFLLSEITIIIRRHRR